MIFQKADATFRIATQTWKRLQPIAKETTSRLVTLFLMNPGDVSCELVMYEDAVSV